MKELKDPGFEEGMPNYWQIYTTGTNYDYKYPEPGRTGGYSVAIEFLVKDTGKMAMLTQDVEIDHTKKYKLSGYLKTQDILGSGASIKVDWKDGSGRYLSTSTIMPYQKGTIPWKYFEGVVTPHANAIIATIILELYDCSGMAWFDDVSFLTSIPVTKYKCYNGQCIQDPAGQYESIEDCQSALKYICLNNQCVTVCPDYQGIKYNTLAECQASCGLGRYHECCPKGCDFRFNRYWLRNNLWGFKPDKEPNTVNCNPPSCCKIYYDDGNLHFGWYWDRPRPSSGPEGWVETIFPEIVVGKYQWQQASDPSTWSEFPKKVSEIVSFKTFIDYNYDKIPTGTHAFAHDIYFTQNPAPSEQKFNIMVWFHTINTGGQGTYVGTFNDGYNTYKVYEKYFSRGAGFWWYGFIKEGSSQTDSKYTCDLRKIFDFCIQKGRLNPSWYINGIELGNEVWSGSGKITVTNYNMEINGKYLK